MNAHLKFYKHAMQNLLFVAPIVFPRIEKMLTFWSLHLNFDKIKKRKKQLLFQKRDFSHFCLKSARKNTLLDALLDKEEAKNSLKRNSGSRYFCDLVHLLVIELERPIFAFERSNIEPNRSFTRFTKLLIEQTQT